MVNQSSSAEDDGAALQGEEQDFKQKDRERTEAATAELDKLLDGKEYNSPEGQAALDLKAKLRLVALIESSKKLAQDGGLDKMDASTRFRVEIDTAVETAELGALNNTIRQKSMEPAYRKANDIIDRQILNPVAYTVNKVDALNAATAKFELHPDES